MSYVNLVDFGLAAKYIDPQGKLLPRTKLNTFDGNILFASASQLNFISSCRKDDMISLLYVLVYLVNKDLPWIKHNKKTDFEIL